jgi:hypothetical protein
VEPPVGDGGDGMDGVFLADLQRSDADRLGRGDRLYLAGSDAVEADKAPPGFLAPCVLCGSETGSLEPPGWVRLMQRLIDTAIGCPACGREWRPR